MATIQTSYMNTIDFSQRSVTRAMFVWGLAAIFYFYELMLLVSPSVMTDDLTASFDTSAEQLGSLAAYYYYAYALMQIPVGLLMDRFGPRRLLTLACLFCTVGCIVFANAQYLHIAELGRFVMGIGGSFAVVGCLKLASIWFPANRFALLTGIMVAVGMMGGVFGQAPVAKLVMSIGWRDTILLGAGLGAILSIIIWFVVSDHPSKDHKDAINQHIAYANESILIWLQFASFIIFFLFPFILARVYGQPVSMLLLGCFYAGWFLCTVLYRYSKAIQLKVRGLLALTGLIAGALLISNYFDQWIQFTLITLSLGFFARMLFDKDLPIPSGLLSVIKLPQVWIASLYAGLMFVPTTGFGQLWGVPYFIERFQVEKHVAGFMVSMIFFGWAVGGPFYGWISDKLMRRKMPMAFAAVSTLIVMTIIIYAPLSELGMKCMMFLLGACSSGFILAFSVVREINAPILTGTAIGFINTLNNASGALAQPIIGKFLDKQWDGTVLANGDPFYSLAMYNQALICLPISILLALIIMPLIKETFCKAREK